MTQGMLDSVWVLLAAFLVFFMHAGFALVESGFCRRKNAVMVLLKNVGVVALSSVVFYGVGYGFMFGDGNAFVGLSLFAPNGTESNVGTLPVLVFLFFQLVFAATACTIVSGAVAERARLPTFFAFTALATAFIYPVVGHWVWGGGWLSELGFLDFAGSTVVHGVGGGMALAGALAVGPRLGKYGADGSSRPMPAHNFPLAALGVLVLWLGWFGFNGGSTVSAEDPGAIARIVLVTNLAASTGFLAALVWTRFRTGMMDLSMGLNGALAGLVGITAGCDVIAPGWALLVGVLAGMLCVEGVFFLERMKVDDPVGAITVHGVCGIFGTLAVGLFGDEVGLFVGGGAAQLGTQAVGAFSGVAFAFAAGALLWFGMKALVPGGIRVSAEHELEGLDVAECGVEAYGESFGDRGAAGAAAMTPAPAPAE
ncbi:MAG: ammonium transporter [Myxococcota bacterium]